MTELNVTFDPVGCCWTTDDPETVEIVWADEDCGVCWGSGHRDRLGTLPCDQCGGSGTVRAPADETEDRIWD